MKLNFTYLLILFATLLNAQSVVDFEEFSLASESFLNGEDGNGGFASGDVFLPNDYNTGYMSWSGWAISNTTDVTTPGFMNQYSAFAGGGFDGSANYATSFSFGANILRLQGDAVNTPVSGLYITNSTYTYLSMQDGDSFTKKFGGVTGDDPDFFLLTIKAYSDGTLSADSVDFYLADFRFSDNSQDYIIDEWTFVDLSSLGIADSLAFSLSSSDVGQFGMNTPAYFCIDNIFASDPLSTTTEIDPDLFEVFPNPTQDYIQINHSENENMDCSIFDTEGKLVFVEKLTSNSERINIQFLPKGNYIVNLEGKKVRSTKIVIKQ